jgi:hypothetical protein
MAAASAEQLREMDAAVRELRRQYARAKERVDANAGGWFASEEEKSIRKAFQDMAPLLERWATEYLRWAAEGRRRDGTAYDVSGWLEFGRKDLADAIEKISGEAYDRSLFAAVKYTVAETGRQLNPANWPLGVKLAAGAGVVVILVVAVAVLARR